MPPARSNAMDHVVVVLFENRSLDNMLGHLYGPEDGKTFEGVIGKDLSNPIPEWAEHGADRKVVPYAVATDMDSPNPDSGEEYLHTNTQLYNTIDEDNRFKMRRRRDGPLERPAAGWTPTMDGFVTDYISYLHRRDGPPAHLRRVRADHDRATRPSRCRCSTAWPGASGCSTTGSARCRRRPSSTGRSGRRPRRRDWW